MVWTNTSNGDSVRSERRASVHERISDDRYNMVASGKDEIANESFVAVYYEVTTEFLWLLMLSYELRRAESSQITTARLYGR